MINNKHIPHHIHNTILCLIYMEYKTTLEKEYKISKKYHDTIESTGEESNILNVIEGIDIQLS